MDSNINKIYNWIDGAKSHKQNAEWISKIDPSTELLQSLVVSSDRSDVDLAIKSAKKGFKTWSQLTPIKRGEYLRELTDLIRNSKAELANIISKETGKSVKDALGEVGAAVLQGEYFSSEGMRLFGKSLTSGVPNKYTHNVRMPLGVAALIVPANTPIANIAWKLFPALICGNSVVIKSSEDTPEIANRIAELSGTMNFPEGVINIIHGNGEIAGKALVEHKDVSVISFTGSTRVGKWIASVAGNDLKRVSLELGGKNTFVVCDDADLEEAVKWAMLSAFSNAGQRCAAGSRIIVFSAVYDEFVSKLVAETIKLKMGTSDDADFGPVINKKQFDSILSAVEKAVAAGGTLLCGGKKFDNEATNKKGYFIEPTLIHDLPADAEIFSRELFGPVASIEKIDNLEQALDITNSGEYGLTSAIHTKSIDKAVWFAQQVRTGTVNVNMGTYGSEPHMPFGGFGNSGNGTREPGVDALNVYSELKNISFFIRNKFIGE